MISNFLLYKLTTGNFVTSKTFFTMFQTSHRFKFASACVTLSQGACHPQTFEDWQSQIYSMASKTLVLSGTFLLDH